MDLQKAKIILEKINTLYKNISSDDSVSSIERDLMLSYIRKLYEEFLSEDATPVRKKRTTRKTTSTPVVVPAPPAPVVVEAPPAPKVERPKPVVIELPDSIKEYATPITTAPKTVPAPTPTPTPTPVVVKAPPAPKPVVIEEEHAILFEHQEAKELSDKLSSMPITDLKKSMGLNEKILTINELFGGDHKAFDSALTGLNALDTFEEAKVYMSDNLAAKYEWASAAKKKKAQIFIKLVRRRYK